MEAWLVFQIASQVQQSPSQTLKLRQCSRNFRCEFELCIWDVIFMYGHRYFEWSEIVHLMRKPRVPLRNAFDQSCHRSWRSLARAAYRVVLCRACRQRPAEFRLPCGHSMCGCTAPRCPCCSFNFEAIEQDITSNDPGMDPRTTASRPAEPGSDSEISSTCGLDCDASLLVSAPRGQVTTDRVPMLVLISLDHFLVHRSKIGELRDTDCSGLDGSSIKAPFYVRNGSIEFLQYLVQLEAVELCFFTHWSHWTVHPIISFLREHEHLDKIPCFDVTYARVCVDPEAIEQITACLLDSVHNPSEVLRQHYLADLCAAFREKTGLNMSQEMSMSVVSDCYPTPAIDQPQTLRFQVFALDEIVDARLDSSLCDELSRILAIVQRISQTVPSMAPCYLQEMCTKQFELSSYRRSLKNQYQNPPPVRKSSFPSSSVWVRIENWFCADGVEVNTTKDGCILKSSTCMCWAGARSATHCVAHGSSMEVVVEILSDAIVRVGWSRENGKEVGTDEFSYGFGSSGVKSHMKRFEQYGSKFGKGDVLICRLSRPRESHVEFTLNGRACSQVPAFTFEDCNDFFFAVCGRPGFEIKLSSPQQEKLNEMNLVSSLAR